ncbi:MAG TPA: BMP family ABC transporter substrate-binding protein [Gaiella sp.]|nr:BMP family ABC transporter substrate-binding protein [Gaiella sp.]
MGSRRTRHAFGLALVAALALLASACGGGGDESDGGQGSADSSDVRVALVTDIGGLNDRGFNALANKGLERAEDELGVQGRVFISDAASDYVPNLSQGARGGYDLVIGVGFLMGDALSTVAKQFPDTKFAIVDFPWSALKDKPANARGLVFAEQEAGYLVGVAAATVAGGGSVSAVGGQAVPAVVAFLAGYRAGVKATDPSMTVAQGYSQDFVDQAKCKELALTQIARGSKAVFAAAGGCGLGALQAAKERNVWGIGVDNDQSFLGPHILTSATKKVDVAVFDTIETVTKGTFEGGGDTLYDVANGGVGYGKVSPDAPDRDALIEKLDDVSKQISSGDVTIPRD